MQLIILDDILSAESLAWRRLFCFSNHSTILGSCTIFATANPRGSVTQTSLRASWESCSTAGQTYIIRGLPRRSITRVAWALLITSRTLPACIE